MRRRARRRRLAPTSCLPSAWPQRQREIEAPQLVVISLREFSMGKLYGQAAQPPLMNPTILLTFGTQILNKILSAGKIQMKMGVE